MSALVDSTDLYNSNTDKRDTICCSIMAAADCDNENAYHSQTEPDTNAEPLSPQSPSSRVGFNLEGEAPAVESKERERYLTAKYPKHQMGLIRKRLAVEDWVDEELKALFDINDDDYKTYDTIIDLDELLNLDTDPERSQYIQQKIAHAPKSSETLNKFVDELLKKARTL